MIDSFSLSKSQKILVSSNLSDLFLQFIDNINNSVINSIQIPEKPKNRANALFSSSTRPKTPLHNLYSSNFSTNKISDYLKSEKFLSLKKSTFCKPKISENLNFKTEFTCENLCTILPISNTGKNQFLGRSIFEKHPKHVLLDRRVMFSIFDDSLILNCLSRTPLKSPVFKLLGEITGRTILSIYKRFNQLIHLSPRDISQLTEFALTDSQKSRKMGLFLNLSTSKKMKLTRLCNKYGSIVRETSLTLLHKSNFDLLWLSRNCSDFGQFFSGNSIGILKRKIHKNEEKKEWRKLDLVLKEIKVDATTHNIASENLINKNKSIRRKLKKIVNRVFVNSFTCRVSTHKRILAAEKTLDLMNSYFQEQEN